MKNRRKSLMFTDLNAKMRGFEGEKSKPICLPASAGIRPADCPVEMHGAGSEGASRPTK
jgi:hypothetical protein